MRPSSGSFSTYQENQNNQTAVEAATTTRTNAMISLFQDVVLPLSCQGKEPLLELMWHAKTHDEEDSPILDQDNHNEQQQQQTKKMLLAMADEWCPQLTGTWNQVTDLYGHDVRVVGLETCPTRPSSSSQPPPSQLRMQPRVAGLFHTGTNAVARLLHRNYGTNTTNTSDLIVWEVPWGKHCPYARRHDCRSTNHNKDNQDENNILPIVLVRDPLRWMRKLCQVPYEAHWQRSKVRQHCPNLIAEHDHTETKDRTSNPNNTAQRRTTVPVTVQTLEVTTEYPSLLEWWIQWNTQYLHSAHPRLMIRVEDLWFHPRTIWRLVDDCLHGRPISTTSTTRQHSWSSPSASNSHHNPLVVAEWSASKDHGFASNYGRALQRYGTAVGRHKGLSRADKLYINHQLMVGQSSSSLAQIFHYPLVPIANRTQQQQDNTNNNSHRRRTPSQSNPPG